MAEPFFIVSSGRSGTAMLHKHYSHLTSQAAVLRNALGKAVVLTEIPKAFTLARDPKDEPYLNLALAAGARYLVTRDKDLLDLMSDTFLGEAQDAKTQRRHPANPATTAFSVRCRVLEGIDLHSKCNCNCLQGHDTWCQIHIVWKDQPDSASHTTRRCTEPENDNRSIAIFKSQISFD